MTHEHSDDEPTAPNRRRFLKATAATAAVGFSAAGSAAAQHTATESRDAPAAETRAALAAHGGDLLSSLAADGVVDSADPVALGLDGGTFRSFDGDRADEIRVTTDVGDGELDIAVEPDEGRAYAFYYPGTAADRSLYRSSGERFDVGTADCCITDCYCTNTLCDAACYQECQVCCPCGSDDCTWEQYCDECLC